MLSDIIDELGLDILSFNRLTIDNKSIFIHILISKTIELADERTSTRMRKENVLMRHVRRRRAMECVLD